jgi:tripartite-type tricarboxylate transporter receptor subunit TctC
MLVKNVVGASGSIGITSWKSGPVTDIVLVSASTNVFNYLDKNLQVTYTDQDFNYFLYVGTMPGLYITRPDTGIRVPMDLKTMMPKSVGTGSSNWSASLVALNKEFKLDSQIVEYKSSQQLIIDAVNGTVDLAMSPASPALLALVQERKLRIVGSTYHDDIVLDGKKIPSVSRVLKIPQFTGFNGFAFRPAADPTWTAKTSEELWQAVNDPAVKESLSRSGMIPDSMNDPNMIRQRIDNQRKKATSYLAPF